MRPKIMRSQSLIVPGRDSFLLGDTHASENTAPFANLTGLE